MAQICGLPDEYVLNDISTGEIACLREAEHQAGSEHARLANGRLSEAGDEIDAAYKRWLSAHNALAVAVRQRLDALSVLPVAYGQGYFAFRGGRWCNHRHPTLADALRCQREVNDAE